MLGRMEEASGPLMMFAAATFKAVTLERPAPLPKNAEAVTEDPLVMNPEAPERFNAWFAPRVTPPFAVMRPVKVCAGVNVFETEV